jgi:protein involved in polysaccharide export with SLBB domain
MRNRFFWAPLLALSLALSASGQNSPMDQVQALKENLSPDQQDSLLQGVLGGKGNTSGKKTDQKLKTPETIYPKTGVEEKGKKKETYDGRVLRQNEEDPELRPDDTVMLEIIPVEEMCRGLPGGANAQRTPGGSSGQALPLDLSSLTGSTGAPSGAAAALSPLGQSNAVNPSTLITFDYNRCRRQTEEPLQTDDEKKQAEKFRQRILRSNPYKVNRFGVLEIPGLPAIPVAGLTAAEATKRLAADSDLLSYFVKLSLLRLSSFGEEALKPFGYDLFEGEPSTFAPVTDIQVPHEYVVGPGDTLDVQLFGNESSKYELTVERDGRINFPKLGPISVSGLTFDRARETIEDRVSRQLIGTHVAVTMGDLRSIRVFVLGEAEKPGSYTVSGLSTMTNALFVSGGVKKIGSLRNIELKRNGRLVTTLDLYDLLLHGDTSNDRQLLPGDVIFIPPIGETVSVYGAVRRPAIYELKSERTAQQAVELAGGLLPDADAKLGQLERILPSSLREMENINLSSESGKLTRLDNGDKLRVPEIRPTLENSVTLAGYVYRPGQFEYRPGLRLSNILGSFDELKPEADLHYIMIRRQVPPEERVEVVSADLRRALAAPGSAADPLLRPRDQITVFDLSTSRTRILEPLMRDLEIQATPDNPEQIVSIQGQVKAPGKYPLEQPTMRVSDLIRAGGSLDDAAYRGEAELTRYAVENGDIRRTEFINVNLAAIRSGDLKADVVLKPYDTLVIKSIPMWMEPGTIEVAGEVRFPGNYPIHQGETLHSVLVRAGGFTDVAFPFGAVFIREGLKVREKEQLEILSNRLQSDLAALSLETIAGGAVTNGANGTGASQELAVGQSLLQQLREAKPVGRLVVDVRAVLEGKPGGPEDVLLMDGDKLLIPKKTQEITILGEIQSPTSHVYEPGLTRDDYIAKSGGTTQKADHKRIYVVRANGDVVTGNTGGWFRRSHQVEMQPGDVIVVPLDTERIRALPLWQAVTTILYNLAVALLAIRSA